MKQGETMRNAILQNRAKLLRLAQESFNVIQGSPDSKQELSLIDQLDEANFLVRFCNSMTGHLNADEICANAAGLLYRRFHYDHLMFSFPFGEELKSCRFSPVKNADEEHHILQKQVTGNRGDCRPFPVCGSERMIRVELPDRLGEIRFYADPEAVGSVSRHFFTIIADCLGRTFRRALDYSRVSELSMRDGLTGLFNRRAFREMLDHEGERRKLEPLSVLMIDIDNFKGINDTFGHPAGDDVIVSVAKAIKSGARGANIVARYGGEEFVVLLPGALPDAAHAVAKRMKRHISDLSFSFCASRVNVTASIGAATSPGKDRHRVEELIEHADQALYLAKLAGKNRVILHGDPPEASDGMQAPRLRVAGP
jgi:two-component system, cell cycle response regulator